MGYDISAFVAQKGTFAEFSGLSQYITVAPLNQGFELIIYDDYLDEALGFRDPIDKEYPELWLSQAMLKWVVDLSHRVPVAYIHAHFFGGNGSQIAALWQNSQLVLRPPMNGEMIGSYYGHMKTPEAPINSVLRAMGVKAEPPQDEFEAIGLKQYRHNEDWFAAYTGYSNRDYKPFELDDSIDT